MKIVFTHIILYIRDLLIVNLTFFFLYLTDSSHSDSYLWCLHTDCVFSTETVHFHFKFTAYSFVSNILLLIQP